MTDYAVLCGCGHHRFCHGETARLWDNLGVATGRCRECDCKRFKEKICSPSQQPTSGTSQNQNPSSFPSVTIPPSQRQLQSPKQSEKPNPFQPEHRDVPVVGFRSWHSRQSHRVGIGRSYSLGSYNDQFGYWKPGKNIARCFQNSTHAAPNPFCGCGFYVLTDFDSVPFSVSAPSGGPTALIVTGSNTLITNNVFSSAIVGGPMMVGAVVGWGRVVQHDIEGWRAEYAQVIALLDCKVDAEHLKTTHEVAEVYGVPVLERKALELLAKEYGDRLR